MPRVIDHGNGPHSRVEHVLVGSEKSVARGDMDDIAAAHHASGGAHVVDQLRRLDSRLFQHPGRARGEFATAGGSGCRFAGETQQRGMADGRTNRIRVRIAMSDHEKRHLAFP